MVRGRLSGPAAFAESRSCVSTSFETIAVCGGPPRGEVAGWGRGRLRLLPLSLRDEPLVRRLMIAAFLGLSGPTLTQDERAAFCDADPAGFVLFARNVADRKQIRALTDSL